MQVWNLLGSGPGFDENWYTAADGSSPVDLTEAELRGLQLTRLLFTARATGEPNAEPQDA